MGRDIQVAAVKVQPHAGHRQHWHSGEDLTPEEAIGAPEMVEAVYSVFPQIQSRGERLTRGGTEDTLDEGRDQSSTGGCLLAQALGQTENRSRLA